MACTEYAKDGYDVSFCIGGYPMVEAFKANGWDAMADFSALDTAIEAAQAEVDGGHSYTDENAALNALTACLAEAKELRADLAADQETVTAKATELDGKTQAAIAVHAPAAKAARARKTAATK